MKVSVKVIIGLILMLLGIIAIFGFDFLGARKVAIESNAPGQISQVALDQISTIEKDKKNRTPVENKLDSHLLYAFRISEGIPVPEGTQRTGVTPDAQGRVLVDIEAHVSDSLLSYIKFLNGEIINSFAQSQSIRANMPLAKIEVLAGRSDVLFIQPAVASVLE